MALLSVVIPSAAIQIVVPILIPVLVQIVVQIEASQALILVRDARSVGFREELREKFHAAAPTHQVVPVSALALVVGEDQASLQRR